jgi:hypothetical protein
LGRRLIYTAGGTTIGKKTATCPVCFAAFLTRSEQNFGRTIPTQRCEFRTVSALTYILYLGASKRFCHISKICTSTWKKFGTRHVNKDCSVIVSFVKTGTAQATRFHTRDAVEHLCLAQNSAPRRPCFSDGPNEITCTPAP